MDDEARGASSSLNKSIGELQRFVGGGSSRYQTMRGGLRGKLDALIWEVGRKAFEAGYREAHAECARLVEETREFPVTIKYAGTPKLSPYVSGLVSVRASVQKIKIFKLPSFAREVSFWDRFKRS